MNDDAQLIKAALDRRFARVEIPVCPDAASHAATTQPAVTISRPNTVLRGLAYAAVLLMAVAVGGLAAQASGALNSPHMPFRWMFVSSKPLVPLIHKADQLTVAEAQRHMPFTIVVPTGMPANSRFMYAHVVSETPIPRVGLNYEVHIGDKYYSVIFNETTVAVGPPVAVLKVNMGNVTKTWTRPLFRWKHGAVVMEMVDRGLPAALSAQIVRANTM